MFFVWSTMIFSDEGGRGSFVHYIRWQLRIGAEEREETFNVVEINAGQMVEDMMLAQISRSYIYNSKFRLTYI